MNAKNYFIYLIIASISIMLSCSEKDLSTDIGSRTAEEIVPAEAALIANKIYADKDFRLIEEIHVRRLKSALALSDQESLEKMKSTQNVPVGKQLNEKDANVLAKSQNFKDAAEFTDYFVKFTKILERYSFHDLPAATANQVMKSLERKCLSNSFSKDNEIISLINMRTSGKNERTQTGWGARPECWKCAFDYIDCQQGYQSGWYSVSKTMEFTKTVFNDSYSVTWSGGNYTVTISYDYGWSTITMNSGTTQGFGAGNGCHTAYANCCLLCNT